MRKVEKNSVYRHYKGNFYYVLTLANHTETSENMVIYHALYDEGETFAKPEDMFLSEVENGVKNPTGQTYKYELVNFTI